MILHSMMRAAFFAACLAALGACSDEQSSPTARPTTADKAGQATTGETVPVGSGFDFYVLSLSWSPTWCLNNDRDGSSAQCSAGSRHAFIVHGLWPQNETGYPEFCRSRESDRVPEGLGRTLFDLIPSMGLIGHQWRKHGSCSGLSQKDYFRVVRAARSRVGIPPAFEKAEVRQSKNWEAIEAAFTAANPGMKAEGIALACDGQDLQDLRICMTKDLEFRDCPELDRRACKRNGVVLPAAR